MMFAIVFWIKDKQFNVVEAADVVHENGVLKEGVTCPVKWRERRGGRRVAEESLHDARIIEISGVLYPFL